MRQDSAGRRGVALATGIGVLWLVFYAGWLVVSPGGQRGLTIFANTAYLVPIVAATVLAVVAARRCPAGLRLFWTLLAVANVLWLGSEALWAVRELSSGPPPFPWWTDVGYLTSYAVMPFALWAAFRPHLRTVAPQRLLDSALVIGSVALVWWWLVLRPLALEPTLGSIVGVAYPAVGLVLVGMLVAMRLVPVRHGTLPMRLVAAGIACSALTDGLYTHAVVTHSYVSGNWIGLGWQAEAVVFALAAFASIRGIGGSGNWWRFRDAPELGSGLLVTGSLAVALCVLVASEVWDTDSIELVGGACVLVALAVARLLTGTPTGQRLVDATTGVYDSDYFADQLRRLIARGRHFGDAFGLVVVEADGATARGGALDGGVAQRLARGGREVDLAAQLGDGRFGILLPNVTGDEALAIADALRTEVASEPLRTDDGAAAVTVSVGVAAWVPSDTPATLLDRAESALAAAQRLGGNQVRGRADDLLLFSDSPLDPQRFELILSLARLVDGREGPDPEHSDWVASLSSEIALEMGLDREAVARAYLAGLLHDLGKIALPEAMLHKPGPLDAEEWEEMTRHAALGAELVEKMAAVREVAPIVAAHHERWDGSGYPRRLEGERIPAEARIVAVADALVAMTTDRAYRSACSETSALTSIWRESGKRYDPAVVSALLALARDGRLKPVRGDGETAASLRLLRTGS